MTTNTAKDNLILRHHLHFSCKFLNLPNMKNLGRYYYTAVQYKQSIKVVNNKYR